MKRILAVDLGTTTGFVAGTLDHHVSGTWDLKPNRYDGGGMRFVRFRQKLGEVLAAYKFEIVAYEEVRRHLGTDAAHVYGGLQAILTAFCEENSIPYEAVPVGTIKKYATGKGNAKKDAMIAAAVSWGYEVADDNEADALALFRMKAVEYGSAEIVRLPVRGAEKAKVA
jgi:crossover junction endodeoxyribonuclease RuvC